jgi:hypothetical protein
MNKVGIAIISGLVGVAAATAVVLVLTAPRDVIPPETVLETTRETTVTQAELETIPETNPTEAGPASPETLPESVATTIAPDVLPAPAPTTTAAPDVLPAPAPTTTAAPNVLPAPVPTTTAAPNVLPAPAPAADEITKEQAEAIALKHAGLTASDVRFARTEYDWEHHGNEWEVEFYYGRTEYSYTINAATGEIIGYEIDND